MRDFDFLVPGTVPEACRMLADLGDDCRIMAGGTALMLVMRQRMLAASKIISAASLQDLYGIEFHPSHGLRIGAMTRHADIARSPTVQRHYPMLADMARQVANPQVRNQGTIGGNICYGDPSTDPPGCLIALNAEVVLQGLQGRRALSMQDFLVDFFVTALEPDEIVIEIRIPPPHGNDEGRYTRFRRTAAEHRPLISVSLMAQREGSVCHDARLVVGASVPVPRRLARVEDFMRGRVVTPEVAHEAADMVATDIPAISDARGSEAYRRAMARVVTRRTISSLFDLEIL